MLTQIVLHRQLPKTSVFGLTSSPRASHPVVPTVGRFLFRQIQYIMIFFKRQYFFFSPKGVSRFAQAANRPLPEERGLTATLDKNMNTLNYEIDYCLHNGIFPQMEEESDVKTGGVNLKKLYGFKKEFVVAKGHMNLEEVTLFP